MRRPLPSLTLLLLAACADERVPIGQVSSRPALDEAPTRLAVLLDRGSIAVLESPQQVLQVDAEVRVAKRRAAEFEDRELRFADHVAVGEEDGTVTLRSAHEAAADGDDWELHLRVHVPAGLALEVKLDAGRLEVRLPEAAGLSANVDAGQVDAEIARLGGPATVRVDAGRVRLAAREAVDAVEVSVAAGQIDLALPDDFAGSVRAIATVGEVDAAGRLGLAVKRDVASQSAEGTVGGEGPRVDLRVDAGQIRIR